MTKLGELKIMKKKPRRYHNPQTYYIGNKPEKGIPKAIRAAGNSAICQENVIQKQN